MDAESNRILQVWSRLLGLYGSALIAKFGERPPPEWDAQLRRLTDPQLRHGLEELLKQGKIHPPSLPEFLTVCRSAREFTPDPQLPLIAGPQLDAWERAANRHLLAHILASALRKRGFNPAETAILVAFKRTWAEDCRHDAKNGELEIAEQKQRWNEAVSAAEAQMAREAA